MLTLSDTVYMQWSIWQCYFHSLLSHITSAKCPTWPRVADPAQGFLRNTENSHRLLTFCSLPDSPPSAPPDTKMCEQPGDLPVCSASEKQNSKVNFMQATSNFHVIISSWYSPLYYTASHTKQATALLSLFNISPTPSRPYGFQTHKIKK